MRFLSTRAGSARVAFHEALLQGLAPDGGLYIPEEWPTEVMSALPAAAPLATLAARFITPFARGDVLEPELDAICGEAFDFPAPLVRVDADLDVLELFHGPTAAFKDFGARFLAAALTRLRRDAVKPLKILVATSGDTGGAVAAAFHRRAGIEVVVLYPKGLVSPTQERQLTCWDGNVQSLAVRGTFDDCQRMVKEAFADESLRGRFDLSSANSINLGRLLPQAVYYVAASRELAARYGGKASFVIPSGNLGNATACIWARRLGAPIGDVVLAHNANRSVPDYLEQGTYRPRPSIATLASAMDVGAPSNLERLTALYPDATRLGAALEAVSIDDAAIAARIRTDHEHYGCIWCPHTAAAAEAYARLSGERRRGHRWVLVSTAHPAKFREIVEPLIGKRIPVPENLARLFERPSRCTEIDPTLAALRGALEG
jgi:threonine synthase